LQNYPGEEFTLELLDVYGRGIKIINTTQLNGNISLNDLKAGIYFLKFYNEGFTPEIKKIIKL